MDCTERIFDLVDKKYHEQKDFARDLGVPASRVSEWRCRKSASFNKRLPEIANLLDTTVTYLLTGMKDDSVPPRGPDQLYLVRKYNQLSKAGQQEVLRFLEFKLRMEQGKGTECEDSEGDQKKD